MNFIHWKQHIHRPTASLEAYWMLLDCGQPGSEVDPVKPDTQRVGKGCTPGVSGSPAGIFTSMRLPPLINSAQPLAVYRHLWFPKPDGRDRIGRTGVRFDLGATHRRLAQAGPAQRPSVRSVPDRQDSRHAPQAVPFHVSIPTAVAAGCRAVQSRRSAKPS